MVNTTTKIKPNGKRLEFVAGLLHELDPKRVGPVSQALLKSLPESIAKQLLPSHSEKSAQTPKESDWVLPFLKSHGIQESTLNRVSQWLALSAHSWDSPRLHNWLNIQHPAVRHITLLLLPPLEASRWLAQLPPEEVVRMLMKISQPQVVLGGASHDLEEALHLFLNELSQRNLHSKGGTEKLLTLLSETDAKTKAKLMQSLEIKSPAIHDHLLKKEITVSKLFNIHQKYLAILLSHCDTSDLQVIFRSLSQAEQMKGYNALSKSRAEEVKNLTTAKSQISAKRLDEAQAKLVHLAKVLKETQKIEFTWDSAWVD